MASFAVLASLIAVASGSKVESSRTLALAQASAQLSTTFDEYLSKHGRAYKHGSAEYVERKTIFEQRRSDAMIQNNRSGAMWIATVNKFSDRKPEELETMHGYKPSKARREGLSFAAEEEDHRRMKAALPEKVDWRHLKDGQRIVEQGACGSCWAIAASTILNAHAEIHRGDSTVFSTQEIVDCVPNPEECGGQGGCQGATVELALGWAVKNGVSSALDVPYHANDGHCKKTSFAQMQLRGASMGAAAMGLTGFRVLPSNKELPLAQAVANEGPVAVSVAANNWFSYYSGIFNDCDNIVNHAVTLYGYGKTSSQKYWLVKNSWGQDWGENGYIRIMRHDEEDEFCGIDNDPQKGVACKNDPTKEITVCGTCGILYDSVVPQFEDTRA